MEETIKKIEDSIKNLSEKKSRIYFFAQDTLGNAKASIKYIYDMALTLKNADYNVIILHEKPNYFGVQSWLGNKYDSIPHQSVEGQNLQIAPEDFMIIHEIFGYVMSQLTNLPCTKIVLSQSYDYVFETLQPGQTWQQFNFTKCITTSEEQKNYVSKLMRMSAIDVIEPVIDENFVVSEKPVKPIISVVFREQRDSINFIKSFYQKYPQFRWITFRDLRGLSQEEFASSLRESMLSVWNDRISSFGTFPLESMKSGVAVMGIVPKLVPSWLSEENGIWIQDEIKLVDYVADFVQNWLEDNVSENLYKNGVETAEKYSDVEKFEKTILSTFEGYLQVIKENFETELNKLQLIEN
jgi:hypothetical protein